MPRSPAAVIGWRGAALATPSLRNAPDRAAPPAPGSRAAPGPDATILLVDDSPMVREVLADILRAAGFAVNEAASGAEALCGVAERPDLVVLDVQLPDLDGFEV